MWNSRWPTAFRHENVSLIYLRSHGFDRLKYTKKSINYVPEMKENSFLTCKGVSRLINGICDICSCKEMKKIREQIAYPTAIVCPPKKKKKN